jgi:hypothetical protein
MFTGTEARMSVQMIWEKRIIIKGDEQFCRSVIATLERINKTKKGNEVISILKKTGVDIDQMVNRCVFYPKGSSPRIYYDPSFYKQWEEAGDPTVIDPTFNVVQKKGMLFVYLYHEISD